MGNSRWESFCGGVYRIDPMSANLALPVPTWDTPRVIILDPDAARDVTLPDARECRLGGPQYYIVNLSTSFDVTVKDNAGGTLYALDGDASNEGVKIHLAQNTTQAGSWVLDVRVMLAGV